MVTSLWRVISFYSQWFRTIQIEVCSFSCIFLTEKYLVKNSLRTPKNVWKKWASFWKEFFLTTFLIQVQVIDHLVEITLVLVWCRTPYSNIFRAGFCKKPISDHFKVYLIVGFLEVGWTKVFVSIYASHMHFLCDHHVRISPWYRIFWFQKRWQLTYTGNENRSSIPMSSFNLSPWIWPSRNSDLFI